MYWVLELDAVFIVCLLFSSIGWNTTWLFFGHSSFHFCTWVSIGIREFSLNNHHFSPLRALLKGLNVCYFYPISLFNNSNPFSTSKPIVPFSGSHTFLFMILLYTALISVIYSMTIIYSMIASNMSMWDPGRQLSAFSSNSSHYIFF